MGPVCLLNCIPPLFSGRQKLRSTLSEGRTRTYRLTMAIDPAPLGIRRSTKSNVGASRKGDPNISYSVSTKKRGDCCSP